MSNTTIRLTPAQSLAIRDLAEDNSLQITVHGRTLDSLEAKKVVFRDVNDTRYTQRYYLTKLGQELRIKELHKQALRDTKAATAKASRRWVVPTETERLSDTVDVSGPYNTSDLAYRVRDRYLAQGVKCAIVKSATKPEVKTVATVVTEALLEGDDATIEQAAESFGVMAQADRNVTEVGRVFHINDKVVDRHDGAVGVVESRYSDGRVGIVLPDAFSSRVVPMDRLDPLADFHQVTVSIATHEFELIPFGTVFEVRGSRYNAVTEGYGVDLYSPELDRELFAVPRESLEKYFIA